MESGALLYLATVDRQRGHFKEGLADAERAVERAGDDPAVLAPALGALARAQLDIGDAKTALATAREARRLMKQIGGVEEGEAAIRLVYAESLYAAGQKSRARRAIESAKKRLGERAARITHGVWRRTFLDNVPEHVRTLALADEWLSAATPARTPRRA